MFRMRNCRAGGMAQRLSTGLLCVRSKLTQHCRVTAEDGRGALDCRWQKQPSKQNVSLFGHLRLSSQDG